MVLFLAIAAGALIGVASFLLFSLLFHERPAPVRSRIPELKFSFLRVFHIRLAYAVIVIGIAVTFTALINSQVRIALAAEGMLPQNPLPFDLPSQSTLKSSNKKVFAHYFTPYPVSLDNANGASDYYATQYLTPNGESGKHAAYGGFLRDRPFPRIVDLSQNWQLNDMKTEVQRASAAGLDGFTVDMLDLNGTHWSRLNTLITAAEQVDQNFKIVLMPDSNSSVVDNVSTLASKIASIASSPSVYKLGDGRLVVSPFYAEVKGASYWSNFVNIMKNTHGINVAFVPCFLNYPANASAFAPFSYGFSNWGNRNPAANVNVTGNITDAHNRGKIWMQPVSFQDTRPNQAIYDEAGNSENLRATWSVAQNGADWVQMVTWNDYSENTQFSPSPKIGFTPLDLSSYYLTGFKRGSAPAITRDVLYISHRTQPFGIASPSQSQRMNLRNGSTAARNTVEYLTYLKQAATVTARIGASNYSYMAPAGEFAKTFPLETGSLYGSVSRNGSMITDVSSKYTIVGSRSIQDLNYYTVSSGREGKVYTQSTSTPAPSPTQTPGSTTSPAPPAPTKDTSQQAPLAPKTVTSPTGQKVQVVHDGAVVESGATISLNEDTVTNQTIISEIKMVEFFNGDHLLQTVTKAPFVFDSGLITKQGDHSITQKTYYKDGRIESVTKLITIKNKPASQTLMTANGSGDISITQPVRNMITIATIAASTVIIASGYTLWWFKVHTRGISILTSIRYKLRQMRDSDTH